MRSCVEVERVLNRVRKVSQLLRGLPQWGEVVLWGLWTMLVSRATLMAGANLEFVMCFFIFKGNTELRVFRMNLVDKAGL